MAKSMESKSVAAQVAQSFELAFMASHGDLTKTLKASGGTDHLAGIDLSGGFCGIWPQVRGYLSVIDMIPPFILAFIPKAAVVIAAIKAMEAGMDAVQAQVCGASTSIASSGGENANTQGGTPNHKTVGKP